MASTWLLVVALSGQGAAPPARAQADQIGQAYYLYIQGRQKEGRDDLAGAAAAYRDALALAPSSADIRVELASVLAQQGSLGEAIAEAQRALSLDAEHRGAHRILGLVQAASAERMVPGAAQALLSDATDHLERALAGGGPDPGVQLTLGDLYVRRANYAKAITTLKAFLLDQPGYPQGVMLLAEAYRRNGQPDEAAKLLREMGAPADLTASAVAPAADLRTRVERASSLEDAGAWREAVAAWRDVVSLGAEGAAFRARLATALVNSGDLAAGRETLLAVTRDQPGDPSAWFLLAQVEARAGNAEASEAAARRVLAIDPKDVRGPLALAEARALRDDHRGVIDALFAPFATANPDEIGEESYARMARDLGAAYFESGDRRRAFAILEDARKRVPDDEELLYVLATAYERDKKFAQAETMFRAVIAREPKNAGALNYLGYLLADRGQKLDEAVQLVTRALAIEADNPSFLDSLGWAYFKGEKFEQARDPLERAAQALPKSSVIQDHLADLYTKLKRYREASDAYDRALSGDRLGIDVTAVAKKRDKAKERASGK